MTRRTPALALRPVVVRALVTIGLVSALWSVGRLTHLNFSVALLALVGVLGFLLSVTFSDLLWPSAVTVDWQLKLDAERHHLPRERRALRLATMARNADSAHHFTTLELRENLRELTRERLVRHHQADPDHPFDHAERVLSASLRTYLTTDGPPPALRRATLAAHLKEIDSL